MPVEVLQDHCLTEPPPEDRYHEWLSPDGEPWAIFSRIGKGYQVSFPGLARFEIGPEGRRVWVSPVPGISQEQLDRLLQNLILPLALSQQGKLILHASAVEMDGEAILLSSRSGGGKSTLAASLSLGDHFRFLTDDSIELEREDDIYQVVSNSTAAELWPDSANALNVDRVGGSSACADYSKVQLALREQNLCSERGYTLARIYFLGDGSANKAGIREMSGSEATASILRNCFILDMTVPGHLRKALEQASQLAQYSRCFSLDYPRHYDQLDSVREQLINHSHLVT